MLIHQLIDKISDLTFLAVTETILEEISEVFEIILNEGRDGVGENSLIY